MHAVAAFVASIVAFVSGLFGPPLLASNAPTNLPATQPAAAALAQAAIADNPFTDPAAASAAVAPNPAPEPIPSPPPAQTVINQPVIEHIIERVVPQGSSGISADKLTAILTDFGQSIENRIAALNPPKATIPEQVAAAGNVTGAFFPASQRIDQLTNTAINTPTITGGSIANASSGSFDALAAGILNLSGALTGTDATFSGVLTAGTLNVAGVSSGGAITGPYFTATSTTATSTFSGGFSLAGYAALSTTTITGALTVNGNTNITQGGQLTVGDKIIAPGEIGIGTTSPYAKLAVQSTSAATTSFAVWGYSGQTAPLVDVFNSAGSNFLRVTSAGNIGIGTANPFSALDVRIPYAKTDTGQRYALQLATNEATNFSDLTFSTVGGASQAARNWQIQTDERGVANAGSLVLQGLGGNVGIGTTSPAQTLSVRGQSQFSNPNGNYAATFKGAPGGAVVIGTYPTVNVGFISGITTDGSGAATANLLLNPDGSNVGIGTTTPGAALTVQNGIDNWGFYKQNGNNVLYASTTNNALAIGASSAAAWMSASSTPWYSVAVGPGALQTTPTNATAQYNTAVGHNALNKNTTGNNNLAYGENALLNNTTGVRNNAFGSSALFSNQTGSYNAAFGDAALAFESNGSYNTAYGANAARGTGAGSFQTQGNTAIGYQAGYSFATGGDYNTFVGFQAGYGITTGTRNTILGNSTIAASYNQITTGSNNIAIGNDVAVPSASANNQLVIGNLIYGTGLNGTGSTLSTGNVGIGTTTPWGKLSITGSGTGSGIAFAVADSSNTPRFVIQDNGNVGIGTTSPVLGKLAVQNSGNITTGLHVVQTGNNGIQSAMFYGDDYGVSIDTNDTSSSYYALNVRTGGNSLGSGGTSRLLVRNDGNVGIGTTTPAAALNIARSGAGNNELLRLEKTDALGGVGATFHYAGSQIGGIGSGNFSITGGAATDIGLYTAANMLFGAGGTSERMRITSTGNVGIGTTSPAFKLDVLAGSASGVRIATNNENPYGLMISNLTYGFGTQGVGIWQGNNGAVNITTGASGASLTMLTSGNVGIGTTTPTAQLSTTGTVRFAGLGSAGANLITDALGNVTASSDERLKEKQGDFTRGLAAINSISPVLYKWRPETGFDTQSTYAGFFAQNVQAAIPEAVSQDSRGYLTLADRPILAAAINAIRELSAKLDALQAAMSGFAERFTTRDLTVSNRLCATKSDGSNVCVTGDQLATLLVQAGAAAAPASVILGAPSDAPASVIPQAPVIELNGNASSTVDVGASYNDLGARIVAPTCDLNLGIVIMLDGATTTAVSIDTSILGTHEILYTVTSPTTGLTGSITRTVTVSPAEQSPVAPTNDNPFDTAPANDNAVTPAVAI